MTAFFPWHGTSKLTRSPKSTTSRASEYERETSQVDLSQRHCGQDDLKVHPPYIAPHLTAYTPYRAALHNPTPPVPPPPSSNHTKNPLATYTFPHPTQRNPSKDPQPTSKEWHRTSLRTMVLRGSYLENGVDLFTLYNSTDHQIRQVTTKERWQVFYLRASRNCGAVVASVPCVPKGG
jgi:hypothetical protein